MSGFRTMSYRTATPRRSGFTLIELLVVIIIATIVLSIAIPRIRAINKERNLREAARVVGSAFANASQRALIDGGAGVRITRNPNLVESAATEVSMLRAVPNFNGDQFDDQVLNLGGSVLTIRAPLEQDSLGIVQTGDFISFGGSSVQYRITDFNDDIPNQLNLTLGRGTNNYMPLPNVPNDLRFMPRPPANEPQNPSYVIHRRPRVLRSSTVELPRGNIIDLRFSGFEAEGGVQAPFGASTVVDVVFREDGSIDQVFQANGAGDVTDQIPLGPLYMMVVEAPISDSATPPLEDPQSLWVAVANNGGTNIGYNNAQPEGEIEDVNIVNARDSSLTTSATQ